MGCTLGELAERISSDEFQGHAEDLGYTFGEEEAEEAEQMTPERMAELLGVQ